MVQFTAGQTQSNPSCYKISDWSFSPAMHWWGCWLLSSPSFKWEPPQTCWWVQSARRQKITIQRSRHQPYIVCDLLHEHTSKETNSYGSYFVWLLFPFYKHNSLKLTSEFWGFSFYLFFILKEGRKEGYVLFNDALNTFFIYGYMASDIWLRTILIVRKETHCRHIGYSFQLAARVLLYAPSHRQDSTYHSLCYTSHGALAGTRNSSMGLKEGRKCFI